MLETLDDPPESNVRLGAHHEVAAAEDVRGDGVDSHCLGLAAVVIDHRRVSILFDRHSELGAVQPDACTDPHEVIHVLQPPSPLPVRFEQGTVHLVVFPVLAGELGSAEGAARVDDDVALDHPKPVFGRNRFEMLDRLVESAAPEIHVAIDPLDRRFRVQLKRQPSDPNEMLFLELFDSDRVDVAPGSNVV